MKIVAVTACPTGIAHTYMAAENLQNAAEEMGIDIKVETQGSVGVESALTDKDIKEADAVVIASDKDVNKDRFIGKKLLSVGVQKGIEEPKELINRAQSEHVYKSGQKQPQDNNEKREQKQNPIYRHLMNGVSYMIPFIVVGGLLNAISLALGGKRTPDGIEVPEGSFWEHIDAIGDASFDFMVPILAAFIAFSIADRPGLVPGMVGGFIAVNGSFYGSEADAGFLGGIIAGFLAGYAALGIKKIKVPESVQPVMPIIFIPIISTLIVGLLFIFVIGTPVASLFEILTNWLEGMQGASSIVLALILGAMIAVDMGGPFNKVAFLFGSAMIGEGEFGIMGPIAVAICVPPIGMGLATFINKKKYQSTDQETGKASFTMGLFGISEGAIPFAAQDPLRVIPSIMVGSMAGSVVGMLGGVGDHVAHGGPIVAVLGAIDNVLIFFVAVIIGSVITAFMVNALKKDVVPQNAQVTVAGAGGMANVAEPDDASDPDLNSRASYAQSQASSYSVTDAGSVSSSSHTDTTDEQSEQAPDDNELNYLMEITNKQLINTHLSGVTQDAIIDEMIGQLDADDRLYDPDAFKEAVLQREAEGTTGMGMNIAIPHGKSRGVKRPSVVFGIKQEGVDWQSMDGTDAKLIFMIAVPEERAGDAHLKILQMLSRRLMDESFRESLLNVTTKDEAYDLLKTIE